jgi:hypothetical protein
MSLALILALIFALFVIAGLGLEMEAIRRTFRTSLELVLEDRDLARKEVETLRNALFPQLSRLQAAGAPSAAPRPGKAESKAGLSAQPSAAGLSLQELFPPRIPWRIRFKQLAAKHNTKQIGLDRHAAAIAQAKDTPHA